MTALYIPTQQEIDHAREGMAVTYTGDTARIERAAALIAAGAIDYISSGIGWSVASQRTTRRQDPEDPEPKAYMVTSTSCGCYDHMLRASAIGACGEHTITVRPACKHIYSVQMYLRIMAAKLDAAIKDDSSPLYAVQMRDSLYGVFDRRTSDPVCGAVYLPKTDTYRPETSQDAADFSRWLAAQPVAVEACEWFAGGLLEKVLRGAPDKVTLRADVVYGDPRLYTFSGYRYDGQKWVHLSYDERQQFNETAWNNLLAACGFIMPGRPVKQTGLAYNYMLERGDNTQPHYSLAAACTEYQERKAVRRMWEADQSDGAL